MSECYVGASSILFASRTSGVRVSVPRYHHAPFSAGQCEYVNNKVRSWLLPPSLFLSVPFVSPFLPLCSSLLFSRRGGASLSLLECGHPPPLLLQPALLFCPLCVGERHIGLPRGTKDTCTRIYCMHACADERRACVRLHTGPGSHGGAFPPGLFIDLHEVL